MLDGNFSYYQAMIDKDFEERQSSEREIKDEAVNILGQTGYENPVSALDENPDYSPFEEEIKRTAPTVRQVERGEKGAQPAWEANPLLDTPNGGRFPQSVTTPQEDPNFPSGGTYQMNSFEKGLDSILNPPNPEYPMTTTGLVPPQPIPAAPFTPMNQQAQQSASVRMSIPPKVGSTAPQIITEQDVANRSLDGGQYIDQNIKGMPDLVNAGEQAKAGIAQGEKQAAEVQIEKEGEQLLSANERLIKQEEEKKAAQLMADEYAKNIVAKVDPDRVWKNKSTWAKIALVLGAAFQGAAGSDAGLKLIEGIVQKDLDAQIDDRNKGITQRGQLLEQIGAIGKSQTETMKLAREASMRIVDGYQKAILAGKKGDAARYDAMMEGFTKVLSPLLKEKFVAEKQIASASAQEQKRRNDDEQLRLRALELADKSLDRQLKKAEIQKLSVEEQNVVVAAANMAQSAKTMANLESRKGFDPTKVSLAIQKYIAGDYRIPSGLDKQDSEYMAAADRYFTFIRQRVTGAAASKEEEARINRFIVATQTNPKDSLREFQKIRRELIQNMVVPLNPEAKARLMAVPEAREYLVDRSQLVPRK